MGARNRSVLLAGVLTLAGPAVAQAVDCGFNSLGTYHWTADGQLTRGNDCLGDTGFRCHAAQGTGFSVEKASPSCNPSAGSCAVKIHVTATIPGLRDMIVEDGLSSALTPWFEWYPCAGAGCTKDWTCGIDGAGGRFNFDNIDNWLARGLSCAQARTLNLSVKIRVCPTSSDCQKTEIVDIPGAGLAASLGCPDILPNTCTEGSGSESGAAGTSCPLCQPVGGEAGCAVSVDGKLSCAPTSLGKAQVRYAAGGAGADNVPGATAWRTVLGRFWSHEYAERIVVDPNVSHVWLLTRHGSFREFSNLATGSGLRLYQNRAPSDEFRKLYFDTATGGWQLHSLDGRKDFFRSDGLWQQTVFPSDPSHPILGTYNASHQLTAVSFPDGRSDSFTYHPSGKLASISENAVAGSGTPSRTWSFTWSGDELTLATRPDGTSWEFIYDSSRPGYLTRIDLVAGPQHRIAAAFEYGTGTNNVAKSWRGDVGFDAPNATDKATYSYTNPALPTQTVVTRTVSPAFNQVTTYNLARDTVSTKPKLTSILGSCPSCGLSPNTTFTYGASRPLLPSSMTDAKGTRTDYTYNSNGRVLTKTEAANAAGLARTASYTYDANFPGLVTRVEVPSTSGGTNKRRTDSAYDPATGVMTSRTIDGFEAGAPLPAGFKTTAYNFNSSGQILTIDPPGFGTADATTFTYNLAGRNGHVADSRTDPLVGTATFGYDGLNRRTSVTDVNGVETQTTYDGLSRVTEIRRKGATAADDLVTAHVYNSFGDLFCTVLPRGNGLEYLYDTAGRLTQIVRGTAIASPTGTSCLDTAQPRERTAWQLDGAGNRIEESLERWNGTAWVSESKTAFEFTCHLDRVTRGAGSATPSVTEYCYDVNHNLDRVWDANHPRATNPQPTQIYAYDALNRLTSVTQPWAGAGGGTAVTSYTYDVQDHLTGVTDAEGNATNYTWSDRDLLTRQVSPVSGTTIHAYNEHGELASEIDARGIVMSRTVDVLDRVTEVTYPNPALNITYTYEDPSVPFSKGRLTRFARHGEAVDYRYDRFGRVLQDGTLTYTWDANGNPATILYPGGVKAVYGYDFADRPETLLAQRPSLPDQPLVTGATYRPSGPLSSLALGNGLTETRSFTNRYFPSGITLGGLLNWTYSTDAIGNILSITDTLNAANNRTYGYQDHHDFLTQGNGPWGPRTWSYDKIGNRLTETRGATTESYTYQPAPGGGNTPILSAVQTPAGTRTYTFGPAGHLEKIVQGTDVTTFRNDASGRLSALESSTSGVQFLYDGRGYLTKADAEATPFLDGFETGNVCGWTAAQGLAAIPVCTAPPVVRPTYNSEGLLHALQRNTTPERSYIFYFAGRPVAQLDRTGSTEVWKLLTTDHLGTPIAATNMAGTLLWQGGFEPFGADWSGAGGAGIFLRFPGQWEEEVWGGRGGTLFYNVHRWYEVGVGRYTQPDPLGTSIVQLLTKSTWLDTERFSYFSYVQGNPINFIDPLGLLRFKGCTQDQQNEISSAFKEYCAETATPEFKHCMCEKPSIPDGLKRLCGDPDLVVRCEGREAGMCRGSCAWSVPFGRTIRLCPGASEPVCGPLGCTLLHELTHILGNGGEKWPSEVERCLGCAK